MRGGQSLNWALAVMLERTKQLLSNPDAADPRVLLTDVLRSAVELLSLSDNDFSWSPWENRDAAVGEVQSMLRLLERGAARPSSAPVERHSPRNRVISWH
jgi:hypothetical protein